MKKVTVLFLICLLNCVCLGGPCPKADLNKDCFVDFKDFAILASEWLTGNQIIEPTDIAWIAVDDPGVDYDDDGTPDTENFNGEISRYETTNGQYCDFLNTAYASGDIIINDDVVYDAVPHGKEYIKLYPADSTCLIYFSDRSNEFTVRSHETYSMTGHPVRVTQFGAKAFCDYHGVRLPTLYEWQAVADYDGSYIYGCGTTIDENKANYNDNNPIGFSTPPYTSPVGYFGPYGYDICDMAGNVYEWTRTCQSTSGSYPSCTTLMIAGGEASSTALDCEILTDKWGVDTDYKGFRVCRGNERPVPDVVAHSVSAAIGAIEAKFLDYTVTHEYSSTQPGYVVAQSPPTGTMLIPHEAVDITVTMGPEPSITWVTVNEPGFSGQMSRHEITNAQYCTFLNAAMATGDIEVDEINGKVYGANGANNGYDYPGSVYCYYYGSMYPSLGIGKNTPGLFHARQREGQDLSNHPVVKVTYYGASAFCKYYGYRLPSHAEWQAVADYDGTYTYGCGTTISSAMANFNDNNPLGFTDEPFTTPVGTYPAYGYGMCDMAGNVYEWFLDIGDIGVIGGDYSSNFFGCAITSYAIGSDPGSSAFYVGFRVCK